MSTLKDYQGLDVRLTQERLHHILEHPEMQEGDNTNVRAHIYRSQIYHGQACIKGTRISVYQIVGMLANGDTIDDLLLSYPTIHRDDILACLDYAASLAEEEVTPIEGLTSSVS